MFVCNGSVIFHGLIDNFFFFGTTTVVGQGLPVPLVSLAFNDLFITIAA